jgi:hypothetical protein
LFVAIAPFRAAPAAGAFESPLLVPIAPFRATPAAGAFESPLLVPIAHFRAAPAAGAFESPLLVPIALFRAAPAAGAFESPTFAAAPTPAVLALSGQKAAILVAFRQLARAAVSFVAMPSSALLVAVRGFRVEACLVVASRAVMRRSA